MTSEFYYVEKPFMEQLEKQGWKIILSTDNSPRFHSEITLRDNFNQVIIESRLRESLKKLNDWLSKEQIEEVINEIKRIGWRKGLVEANRDLTNLLLEQTTVVENEVTGHKSPNVNIIDFENVEMNDFLAINQFRVNTPGTVNDYVVPDIVLFINGIPIGVIECKYPTLENSDPMEEGITQLLRYSNRREEINETEGNERLFHYNQIMLSTTKDEARVGTITSDYDHYLEWKDTYPVELDPNLKSQERLILGALKKENIIDLIRNFTLFLDTEKGKKKILARYHQFRAVNKTINRLINNKTPEEKSGVIWHTQGSGKSLSMVFLIRKLRTIGELKKLKIVIVTDRKALEKQLKGTAGLAEKPHVMKDTGELIEELKNDTSNLIMVMVQKFLKRDKKRVSVDDLPDYVDFPKLNDSEDILILVDEAHRTQGGIFGANIINSLPYASRIGFTGTPLISDKVKIKTYELFGQYIDKYRMKESEADGATLPIRYEGKTVNMVVDKDIDTVFEDMFSSKNEKEKQLIKQKYGTKGSVLEAKRRIKKISKDIVLHYFENAFDDGFKAQVVASTRLAAVRYKKYIDKALEEYIENYGKSDKVDIERLKTMQFIKSATIISPRNNDPPEWIKYTKNAQRDLGEDNINFKSKFNFDNPKTGITFLIVADMLLTGFDAEIEQIMYLDKRMTDHTLLQAIARVNRVDKNKKYGLIVDYYGVTNHLKEALDAYSADDLDLDDVFLDLSVETPRLKTRYDNLVQLFNENKVANIEDYVNYRVKNEVERLRILDQCLDCLENIKIRADFNVKYRLFIESMDLLLSKPAAKDYIPAMKAFGHIHARARYRFRDPTINIMGAGQKVRDLIDSYLISVGIDTKLEPIEITADDFTKTLAKGMSERSKASEMEHAIRRHCKVNYDKDPVFYTDISERLLEIIGGMEGNWEEQIKFMEGLREEIRNRRDQADKGIDYQYLPFYDSVLRMMKFDEEFLKENEIKIRNIVIKIVDEISDESSKVGFWGNPTKEKRLRANIDDMLIDSGIDELYDSKDVVVTCFIRLAKNRRLELKK